MPPQLTTVRRPLTRRRPASAGPSGIRVFAIDMDKPDTGTYRCQLLRTERLTLNRAGDVVLQLKSPHHDGTTHVVMSPLEFMQRLAALVPRPRLHLIRLHGLLAPNAKRRSEIVPSAGRQADKIPVPGLPGAPINATDTSDDPGDVPQHSAPVRMSWGPVGWGRGVLLRTAPPR